MIGTAERLHGGEEEEKGKRAGGRGKGEGGRGREEEFSETQISTSRSPA